MFQPLALRGMVLPNRVVMSPMDMYSAVDGVPQDWHLVHYGARAIGGAALMFTEMTCPSPQARITLGCTGLWNDEQEQAWAKIVDFVHANSAAKLCLQLGHSGRKGATKLMWEGMDRPLDEGAWDVCSASAVPYFPDSAVPRELDRAGMDRITAEFVAAARARRARRLRHARAALRARLSVRELHLAADEPPQRRIRRHAREPPALSARRVHGDARSLAGAQADVGAHLGDRLGRGRAHRRRGGRCRARLRRGGRRPRRRLDRADGRRGAADLRAHVPDAVRGPDPQRGARRDDVRRRHHDARPSQHDSRRRARRPRRARRARTSSTRSSP